MGGGGTYRWKDASVENFQFRAVKAAFIESKMANVDTVVREASFRTDMDQIPLT
jgi:hypothetical protein